MCLCRYHYGKFSAVRANEAAKLDTDEETALIPEDTKVEGQRVRSWGGDSK